MDQCCSSVVSRSRNIIRLKFSVRALEGVYASDIFVCVSCCRSRYGFAQAHALSHRSGHPASSTGIRSPPVTACSCIPYDQQDPWLHGHFQRVPVLRRLCQLPAVQLSACVRADTAGTDLGPCSRNAIFTAVLESLSRQLSGRQSASAICTRATSR